MRRDIDRHPRRIKDVLTEERMRKEFFDGCSKNEAKAVKAFVSANAENALKTKPKNDASTPSADCEVECGSNANTGGCARSDAQFVVAFVEDVRYSGVAAVLCFASTMDALPPLLISVVCNAASTFTLANDGTTG
ncbi:hypothetical protein LTR37_012783 [Vermiconidia calcicola]|uniref:Uncharacterized protein n=1 Tax=Vermiconidia calcicola TaxID=1690605 RepID=A0ACC3MZJ5_9PEZI|nr:hypothetical protein LTR37_012783 [Vermiconidia calcicola]